MQPVLPASPRALRARALVLDLQARLVDRLEEVARALGRSQPFHEIAWLRDDGRHGGGQRRSTAGGPVYDRASVNVSVVHYDDEPHRRLGSATALSAIVHPAHPRGPSMHVHTSWTELRDGEGTWRVMADLNPAIPDEGARERFREALRRAAPDLFAEASAQGDRYFRIPALDRHRGVAHWYLEGHRTSDPEADLALARRVEEAAVDTYGAILRDALVGAGEPTAGERAAQLAYHTLYLFQVLTLDRGTTSGLLVHDQNDVGILGSLPGHVDPELLASWASRVPAPQDQLVRALVEALPDASPAPVDDDVKRAFAAAIRRHYAAHPEALALQARGDTIPPTVANHRS